MVELWDERALVKDARIAAYRYSRDGLHRTQHVFDYVLTDTNGRTTAGTISLQSAHRVFGRTDPRGAVALMIHAIALTPIHEFYTLVETHFV